MISATAVSPIQNSQNKYSRDLQIYKIHARQRTEIFIYNSEQEKRACTCSLVTCAKLYLPEFYPEKTHISECSHGSTTSIGFFSMPSNDTLIPVPKSVVICHSKEEKQGQKQDTNPSVRMIIPLLIS